MLHRREVFLGALAACFSAVRAYADAPSDEAIHVMLQERVGIDRESTGIVAVVSDSAGSRLSAYGRAGTAGNRPLDGDTVFEIGSITKVLTALILADMVERSEVAMTDPVAKYLPASKVPEFQGKPITLLDLATYTSGLPNMPDNFVPKDELDHWWALPNPFADYTVEKLYAFLSGYELKYQPGTHYEYANLGFGLLGHALARRAGKSYEALLVERICDPLDLRSTRITLTEDMRSRLAHGHNGRLEPTPLWDFAALAGCGAVRSTANDLTAFLEACLGRRQTPLQPALRRLLETRRPADMRGLEAGLGWFISSDHSDEIAWKDGGTGGFATFIGFSLPDRQGAIVLSNRVWTLGSNVDDLGMHLINPDFPLRKRKQRRLITLPPEVLVPYAGTYTSSPAVGITVRVRVRGSRLFFQFSDWKDEVEAFPETETWFFVPDVFADITFEKDAAGNASSLVVHHDEDGPDWRATRVQ
jgi:D-alanyl-D-alanine-carboxypeptidase/D-alanyl-D-alanine-endopeptidase